MGNPSDGFHGKTIALSIANFWAEVTIIESAKLVRCVCSLPPSHPLILWLSSLLAVQFTVFYQNVL